MTEHSPLPWQCVHYGIVDANRKKIFDGHASLSKLDASLIITAVNSHDRLIEAANEGVELLEAYIELFDEHDLPKIRALKTAIAAAEELTP